VTGVGALPPLGASTLGDRLAEVIEEAILEGTLAPGQRLHPDQLARQFAVSRIPVREALRSLEAGGWIELRPHQGAYVRRRTAEEQADLFEARELVEPRTAALAAARRTAAQLEGLDALVAQGRAAARAGDVAAAARVNARFHALVATCSANTALAGIVEGLSKRTRFSVASVPGDRARRSVEEHALLVGALRRGDAAAAAAVALEHVAATRRAVPAA